MRVLITGGSGFIGTNLVDHFLQLGTDVANLDVGEPRNHNHRPRWRKVDILDEEAFARAVLDFSPTHLVHLAARTDLQGNVVGDYAANTLGVASVIKAVRACRTIERAIFASSMLVCGVGYRPKSELDYAPSTPYGQSKAIAENLIRHADFGLTSWVIIRPTSIWGPWFGEPYLDFFTSVMARRFVSFSGTARKTFGYVQNTVFQIAALLCADPDEVHQKTVYLGDRPPLKIEDWANQIAGLAGVLPPRRVPRVAVWFGAKAGDIVEAVGVRAPLTSFRLRNMTTDNEIDLDFIYAIAGAPPCSVHDGIQETLVWLRERTDDR